MTDWRIGIVVLAAGGSARMGRPKQLLPLAGKSLVRHATQIALDAGGDPVVVVIGAAHDGVAEELAGLAIHLAPNPAWDRGIGSSIRIGVETLLKLQPAVDALIITLCDQPGISAQSLRNLIDAHRNTRKPLCAAAFNDIIAPPALFGREFFDSLSSLPDATGAKQILLKHAAELLRVDCPEAAGDIDTPADYDTACLARVSHQTSPPAGGEPRD